MAVRRHVPRSVKRLGRSIVGELGGLTADIRMLPAFTIAGAQRSGTTSMYRALMMHPLIHPAVLRKGVNYFDLNQNRGMRWYRGHFPIEAKARAHTRDFSASPVTFDASGYYMFHPLAPQRMAAALPQLKVIAMLRDPVERAYSAHKHELARGFEMEPFERAIELEPQRLAGEVERLRAQPNYHSIPHRHQAYVTRGQYVEQVERLLSVFPSDQLLIVESENFFEKPEIEFARILEFLELPVILPPAFERYNARPRSAMAESTRARLQDYFEPYDVALGKLLGHEPAWRR